MTFQKASILSLWWACMQTCFMFKHCLGCTASPLVSSTTYKKKEKNHFDQTNMSIQWSSGPVLGLSLPPPHQSPIKPSDLSDSPPWTDESHANSRFRLITIHTTSLWFLQCTTVWVLQLIRGPNGTSGLVGYSLWHCLFRRAMCVHLSAYWSYYFSLSKRCYLFTLLFCFSCVFL